MASGSLLKKQGMEKSLKDASVEANETKGMKEVGESGLRLQKNRECNKIW